MVTLLPQCTKCGSFITDSLESEIEQHGKIKIGNYINGEWICNDCLSASQIQEQKNTEKEENKSSSINKNNDNSRDSNDQYEQIRCISKYTNGR
jgi:hypothetical protein